MKPASACPRRAAPADRRAGRMCPADYRYPPSVFDRPPELTADVLYVVGGLYGNLAALDEVERLAARRARDRGVQRRLSLVRRRAELVRRDRATRGAPPRDPRQCGDRDRAAKRHRRRLRLRLSGLGRRGRGAALERNPDRSAPHCRRRCPARPHDWPRCRCIWWREVGGLRIGIVHGDATGLAGWSFAHDALDDPAAPAVLERHPPGRARRRFRFDPHLPRRVARFSSARRPPDDHQQRRGRHAQFLRDAVSAWSRASRPRPRRTGRSMGSRATAFTSTPSRIAYDHDAFLEPFPGALARGLGGACVLCRADRRRAPPTRSRRQAPSSRR